VGFAGILMLSVGGLMGGDALLHFSFPFIILHAFFLGRAASCCDDTTMVRATKPRRRPDRVAVVVVARMIFIGTLSSLSTARKVGEKCEHAEALRFFRSHWCVENWHYPSHDSDGQFRAVRFDVRFFCSESHCRAFMTSCDLIATIHSCKHTAVLDSVTHSISFTMRRSCRM
jgi:hypothetical protein